MGDCIVQVEKRPLDKKLIKHAMKGERDAINKLCEMESRSLLYISIKIMNDKHDGEDLSQEICIRMARDIVKLKNAASFKSWLYAIINGEYNRYMRKRIKEGKYEMRQLPEDMIEPNVAFNPEWYLEDEESRGALAQMLADLPADNKMCMIMFYYEHMSHKEIAEAMNIRKDKVDHLLRRSRELMRKNLEKSEHSKDLIQHFAALVSVPVMGTFMEMEAEAIPQALVDRVAENALSGLTYPTVTAASGMTAAVKVVAVTAAVAVGATTGYSITNSNRKAEQAAPQVVSQVLESTPTPAGAVSTSVVQAIITLEDMIGSENVALLNAMTKASPIAKEDFDRFVANTGILHEQEAWVEAQGDYYDLYNLDKQDKRLMLIVNRGADGTLHGLTYRFTTTSEAMPHSAELLHRYSDWRT